MSSTSISAVLRSTFDEMKVLHVISGIDPKSGGPTRSATGICRALSQAGVDVTLLVLHGRHAFENPCGVKAVYAEGGERAAVDPCPDVRRYDLVHLQGIWDWTQHKIAQSCRKYSVPYVISPRGMLDPWALSVKKWKKRLAMLAYQSRDLKRAAAFHVTAEMEKGHVRSLGYGQPCIVAPNGVQVPDELPPKKSATPRVAIFLSRLHPGKGLLTLAEAWARARPQNWVMRVVGPDSYGHKAAVVAKLEALGIRDDWVFENAMNDDEKWIAYRSADVLVHPSVSENFGITIAEGLYAELPVICTRGTPWKDVVENDCGLWVEQGAGPLSAALSQLLNAPPDRIRAMGARGRQLIISKYSWPMIACAVKHGYEQVRGNYGN